MDKIQLNEKISKIPPHLIPEIIDYIDFLISKQKKLRGLKNSLSLGKVDYLIYLKITIKSLYNIKQWIGDSVFG